MNSDNQNNNIKFEETNALRTTIQQLQEELISERRF
jgi:hypothetical protein